MAKTIFRKELEKLNAYVPGKPIEDVMREYGLTSVVKLASNENPLGPSPKAVAAVQAEAAKINIYPDPAVRTLREKLAEKYGVSFDQVMVGNGGESLIQLVAQSIISPGDEVITADPSFSLYEISVSHMGGTVHVVPLLKDSFQYDLESMLSLVNDKTKIVYICNPNNPTGTILGKAALNEFADKLPEEVVLFLDEAYYEFASAVSEDYPNGLEILARRPNTIVLRTFAKVAGIAGTRVGYIFSTPEMIAEIGKSTGVFSVNRLAQVAALAALDDTDHIENSVALNKASLQAFKDYFDTKGLRYIEPGGNFIWVDVNVDTRELYVALQKEGVIVRPGFLWGWDSWLRISSGNMQDTEICIEALDKLL
ncbi:MAG TPA: histidinol-phosphate transaminase [Tissierellia bacterium]|nr:histidinol-phosphate transaminase [Tissierellia bacterium]